MHAVDGPIRRLVFTTQVNQMRFAACIYPLGFIRSRTSPDTRQVRHTLFGPPTNLENRNRFTQPLGRLGRKWSRSAHYRISVAIAMTEAPRPMALRQSAHSFSRVPCAPPCRPGRPESF